MASQKRHDPHDIGTEQHALGACLRDSAALDTIAAGLDRADFLDPYHQRLFDRILTQRSAGAVTVRTLAADLKTDPGFEATGGEAYLDALRLACPASPPLRAYIGILKDCTMRRGLLMLGEDLTAGAYQPPSEISAQALAGEAVGRLLALAGSYQPDRTQALSVVTAASLELAEKRLAGETVPRITTGLKRLDKGIGGLQPGDHLVVAGRSGMGKEQPTDTPVLTPTGWTTMGALKVGDLVVGADGCPTAVLAIWPQGEKQAYSIWFRDGTSVECGEEHLWTIIDTSGRRRGKPYTVPLKYLSARGVLSKNGGHVRNKAKWKIPVTDPVQFAEVDFPTDPYVLGVLLGDGSISGRDLRYSNPDMDSDIRQRVRDRLPTDLTIRENRQGACPYFAMTGPGAIRLKADLRAIGVAVKSGEKFIPDKLLRGSVAQRLDLLRGLMDTDGSCLANRTSFYTTSPRLADGVCQIVRSLGGIAILRTYNRSHRKMPTEYVVNVKMDICPFYTSRKAAPWKPTPPAKAIFGIKPTRVTEQVCITVAAADGLYLTKDFIVTHNTAIGCSFGRAAAMDGAPVMAISADMTKKRWGERTLTDVDHLLRHGANPVKYGHFRGKMGQDAIARLAEAHQVIRGWAFDICDEGEITVSRIRAKVRAMANRYPGKQGLLLVDFLQKIQSEDHNRDRRRDEDITALTYAIGDIVKDVGWSAVSLAQLKNKDTDGKGKLREDPPTEADIRESGGILMAADIVIAPHRKAFFVERREPPGRDYHEQPQEWKDWEAELRECRNDMQIIGFKNRDDAISKLNMTLWCDLGSNALRDERPRDWPRPASEGGRDPGEGLYA